MKKKYIIIGIVALLLFWTVCIVGYLALSKYIEVGDYKYFCEEIIQAELQQDETFESQYGEVVSVTLDETRKYSKIGDGKRLIPVVIEIDTNEKYFAWVEFDISTYMYDIQYDSLALATDD